MDLAEEDYYYTYAEFRHGCFPQYLRQGAYNQIAGKIKLILGEA